VKEGLPAEFDPRWVEQPDNPLASCYRDFHVAGRLLLTGHSHQAWPDRARKGLERAWIDAAEGVDAKWEAAFREMARVQEGYRRLLGDAKGPITLSESTHNLLVRLLSALDWRRRRQVVTTDEEFYAARRQLQRLEEEGVEVTWVAARPAESVGERLAAAVDDRTAACLVSTVFFSTAEIAGGLEAAQSACDRHGAILILDAYHHLNVVPFDLEPGLAGAFVVGGGYKYCQLGEGNAFLRTPPDCELRPVVTGWFAAFDRLYEMPEGRVPYSAGFHRFMGATFDPVSHYRAAEVFTFFADTAMTSERLRRASQWQIERLRRRFDALDLPPDRIRRADVPLERLAGFLALEAPRAGDIRERLLDRGVVTDSRRDTLRLGPAPYLSRRQLDDAVEVLGEVVRELE
jgi:kynureninase